MALGQADLDSLDEAIASGVLEVQREGRRIRYQSLADLMAARAHVAQQIANAAAPSRSGTKRFVFASHRGD